MHEYTTNPDSSGIDVPLSVWPIWNSDQLIERLVRQFTVEGDTVALLGLPGLSTVIECNRDGVVVCDAATAAAEFAALQRLGPTRNTGIVAPVDAATAFDRIGSIHDVALTICAPRPARYRKAWAVAAGTIRPFGLLAIRWDGPLPPDASAACAAAGLSYAGHIVAAEVDAFDRAALAADSLETRLQGRPRRAHTNLSLWARYPDQRGGEHR